MECYDNPFYTCVMLKRDNTEKLRSEIAQRVRSLRKAAGKTQESLADQAGVSPEHLSKIETARRLPSVETLLDLAEALGVEPAVILGRKTVDGVSDRGTRIGAMLASLSESDACFVESEVTTWVAQIRKMRMP